MPMNVASISTVFYAVLSVDWLDGASNRPHNLRTNCVYFGTYIHELPDWPVFDWDTRRLAGRWSPSVIGRAGCSDAWKAWASLFRRRPSSRR